MQHAEVSDAQGVSVGLALPRVLCVHAQHCPDKAPPCARLPPGLARQDAQHALCEKVGQAAHHNVPGAAAQHCQGVCLQHSGGAAQAAAQGGRQGWVQVHQGELGAGGQVAGQAANASPQLTHSVLGRNGSSAQQLAHPGQAAQKVLVQGCLGRKGKHPAQLARCQGLQQGWVGKGQAAARAREQQAAVHQLLQHCCWVWGGRAATAAAAGGTALSLTGLEMQVPPKDSQGQASINHRAAGGKHLQGQGSQS